MNQTAFHQLAIDSMKRLWRSYLIDHSEAEFRFLLNHIADDFIIIGTGKHEIFKGADNMAALLAEDQQEQYGAQFEIMDEWYEAQTLSEDLCFVYGGFYAQEISHSSTQVIADMDTRFTAVYRYENGEAILCNLHHSVPNMDQAMGEFYPKTITQKANDAIERSMFLEQQLKLDSLTGLYNRTAYEKSVSSMLAAHDRHCAFLMIDIDDFKSINDNYGHLQGDLFLRSFADLLNKTFCHNELISRLGGDEFSVFIADYSSRADVEALIASLLDELKNTIEMPFSCTIGIAYNDKQNSSFHNMYKNADKALYFSKSCQKGSYTVYK